jgi:catechol 2,3-dioxygenase-like lactoylglutathione lyase family enzyme
MQHLAYLTLLVPDYDDAIRYFTQALDFDLVEDAPRSPTKRWVRVAPKGSTGAGFLLAQPTTPEQEAALGNQCGGRVWLFLHTDDFWTNYNRMQAFGVDFTEEPRHEEYGTVVVFRDPWGNKWDYIGPKSDKAASN